MKNILMLLFFLSVSLNALDRESTLKIYHGIFQALSPNTPISVYTNDKEYRDVFIYSNKILLSKYPEQSDLILITNEALLSKVEDGKSSNRIKDSRPILFVTDYRLLKSSSDIVGAFYWRKGRTQLLFIKSRLQKFNISLPDEYKKYIVDEL